MAAWTTNNTSDEFGTGSAPGPLSGHANPAPSGLDFEGVQRLSGTAQPAQFGKFMDELSGGDDNASWTGSEE